MGSFISLDNVYKTNFYRYEGLYTTTLNAKMSSDCFTKSGRKYLCRYQKGTWDRLPVLYQKNAGLCQKNNLQLNGYAYEAGLNDFVISDEEDYITKIMIKIDEIS